MWDLLGFVGYPSLQVGDPAGSQDLVVRCDISRCFPVIDPGGLGVDSGFQHGGFVDLEDHRAYDFVLHVVGKIDTPPAHCSAILSVVGATGAVSCLEGTCCWDGNVAPSPKIPFLSCYLGVAF